MKKLYTLSLLLLGFQVQSQKLLFPSEYGGAHSNGAIIQYDLSNNQTSIAGSLPGNPHIGFNLFQQFSENEAYNGGLILGSDGYYYGVSTIAHSGHHEDYENETKGMFYRLNATTYATEVLHVFENNSELNLNGDYDTTSCYSKELAGPIFKVVEISPGVFYGIAAYGGSHSYGGAWKYTLSTNTYKKIGEFDKNIIGNTPAGNLIKAGSFLYGVLLHRNNPINNQYGHLYRINLTNDSLEYYHDLNPNPPVGSIYDSHDLPVGNLVYNSTTNKIYGAHKVASSIQNYGGGVWEFNLTNNEIRNKKGLYYSEIASLGSNAMGMVAASNGNYYVITKNGGANGMGSILHYDVSGDQYFKIFDFPAGFNPSGNGLSAVGSKIVGTFLFPGGVWTYDLISNTFNGDIAKSNLPEDAYAINGNDIIGKATEGSTSNAGYFFKYNVNSSTFDTLQKNVSLTGRNIIGEMTLLGDTSAIVIISKGGETNTSSNTEIAEQGMLAIFNFANQSFTPLPNSTLKKLGSENYYSYTTNKVLYASNQKLYYSLYNYYGTNHSSFMKIRCYDLATHTATDIHTLSNFTSGIIGLKEINNRIYAAYDDAIVLFNPTNNSIINSSVTHDASVYGAFCGNLHLASNGKIYGMTIGNDPNSKIVIYSLDTNSLNFTVEHQFDSLIRTTNIGLSELNGKLYGSTNYGGANNNGYLFSFDITSKQFTNVHDFDAATDGSNFQAAWTVYNGKLYSTSYSGGQKGNGTLVNFDPSNNAMTTLTHLTVNNGRSMKGSPIIISATAGVEEKLMNDLLNVYPNPTTDKVTLSGIQIDQIKVYNLQGVLVKTITNSNTIDLTNYATGVYNLQIKSNQHLLQRRVVKQ